MAQVKLTYSGTDYIVRCTNITPGWRNLNVANPNANGGSVVEVQTQSFENPTYSLGGVHILKLSTDVTVVSTTSTYYLAYNDLLNMAKSRYDGTNPIVLTVTMDDSSSVLLNSAGSSTGIKVVVDSFNFPIDVDVVDYGGSRRYFMSGTVVLRETA
jgi:hypothetical protein